MPRRTPDLRFGPGPFCGFTPAGVAAFDNLLPAVVVRELIQNALDAARDVDIKPAIVRFRLTRAPKDAIPGIKSYESAFDKAVKTQEERTSGTLTGQALLTANTIREALARDEVDILSVLDNGVGLDKQRMDALLGDGASVKDEGSAATGTYGNGHSTAIPASDLRYILYGGLTKGRGRIGAGHAVLASHHDNKGKRLRSGHGFYIRTFKSRESFYDYATGKQIPPLIAQQLDLIEAEAPHGAAVIIPAFNHFLEKKVLWPMVSHAAAANFFVAIEEGDLVVFVEDDRPGMEKRREILNRSTIADVLGGHRDQKRAKKFLSGRRAYEAHIAYRNGESHFVETDAGKIEIRLRENPDSITRVDLCRNGMWITGRIPGISQNFAGQVPFHAILSLNARDGRDLHNFIRMAEGPLHDAITIKRLEHAQGKACRSALKTIGKWIVRNTQAVKSDAYLSNDFLTLDFGDGDGSGKGNSGNAFWGLPTPIRRSPVRERHPFLPAGEPEEDIPLGRSKNAKAGRAAGDRRRARPSLPAFFQVASRPAGKNRRRIWIECEKNYADAQLRLVVDEALDATCERPGQDPYTPAALDNITINEKPAGDKDLIRWEGQVVGVQLGNLAAGMSIEVETDYQLRGDFSDLSEPSLRVEVFRTEQGVGANASDRKTQEVES